MKSGASTSARTPARRRAAPRARRAPSGVLSPAPKKRTHRRSGEIIEAAARVFAARGYHGATTQDIADVLNIRQASLYYYFPSKEVALELVCMRGVDGFVETAKAIEAGPGSATERLCGLIRAHIAPLLDRSDFVKVFLTQRQFLPAHSRRKVGKGSRSVERIFEHVIRAGQRNGEFRDDIDPRLATLGILSMLNGCSAWYRKEQLSLERIGGGFIALVLQGLKRG